VGSRSTVLVITAPEDPTADAVISEIHRRGAPVARFDLGAFPLNNHAVAVAVAFAEQVDGPVICKTLSSIVLADHGQNKINYTAVGDPATIDPAAFATTAHNSWAEITSGDTTHTVTQSGPRRIWPAVERAVPNGTASADPNAAATASPPPTTAPTPTGSTIPLGAYAAPFLRTTITPHEIWTDPYRPRWSCQPGGAGYRPAATVSAIS